MRFEADTQDPVELERVPGTDTWQKPEPAVNWRAVPAGLMILLGMVLTVFAIKGEWNWLHELRNMLP